MCQNGTRVGARGRTHLADRRSDTINIVARTRERVIEVVVLWSLRFASEGREAAENDDKQDDDLERANNAKAFISATKRDLETDLKNHLRKYNPTCERSHG